MGRPFENEDFRTRYLRHDERLDGRNEVKDECAMAHHRSARL